MRQALTTLDASARRSRDYTRALPTEILCHVFSMSPAHEDLNHCMMVSRSWASNAVQQLWAAPRCHTWEQFACLCRTLRAKTPSFKYRDLIHVLDLSHLAYTLSDRNLRPFIGCTQLQSICMGDCLRLTDSSLTALLEGKRRIRSLQITNNIHITGKFLEAGALSWQALETIQLGGCRSISNNSIVALVTKCQRISCVSASVLRLDLCLQTGQMDLQGCVQLEDATAQAIARHCVRLERISLWACDQVTPSSIKQLLQNKSQLRELDVGGCTKMNGEMVPEGGLGSLAYLLLEKCPQLTDCAMKKLVDKSPNLREIHLDSCKNVTDESLLAISALGRGLRKISIAACQQVTDSGIKALCMKCTQIESLDISYCSRVTRESADAITSLTRLRFLDLSYCSVTDEWLAHINRLAELHELGLDSCRISDTAVRLVAFLPKIQALSLRGCRLITDEAIHSLCENAPQLRIAALHQCVNLSIKVRQQCACHFVANKRIGHHTSTSSLSATNILRPARCAFCPELRVSVYCSVTRLAG